MKKLIAIAMLATFASAPALAADPNDVYTYTRYKTITFNHKTHGEKLGCAACHGETVGKIQVYDEKTDKKTNKAMGHAVCLDCHNKIKSDYPSIPTKCGGCHVKQ